MGGWIFGGQREAVKFCVKIDSGILINGVKSIMPGKKKK